MGWALPRERGSTLGRPLKLREEYIENARELLDSNPLQTLSGLARNIQVSPRTLTRAMDRV